MKSFDDVLKDDPEEKVAEPVAQEPALEPKVEEPKEPEAKEPPKVEESAPTAPEPEQKHVPLAALEDERRKRQEIQRELEALRSKPAAIDPVVDPEGFRKHFEEQSQKALVNERLNMSEQIVRSHLGDETVDEAMQAFEEAEKSNPGLRSTILASRHPYQSLVEWHKREQTLATVGTDLTAYEQRLREKWMEEVKANPAALGIVPTSQQPVAPSLANRPSVGARDSFTGPTPLGDILKP